MRVLFVDGNVAARRLARREGGEQLQTRAVVDARGLEQQSIGRVEQAREDVGRGQAAGQVGIGKGAEDDEHAQPDRKEQPDTSRSRSRGNGSHCAFVFQACVRAAREEREGWMAWVEL